MDDGCCLRPQSEEEKESHRLTSVLLLDKNVFSPYVSPCVFVSPFNLYKVLENQHDMKYFETVFSKHALLPDTFSRCKMLSFLMIFCRNRNKIKSSFQSYSLWIYFPQDPLTNTPAFHKEQSKGKQSEAFAFDWMRLLFRNKGLLCFAA